MATAAPSERQPEVASRACGYEHCHKCALRHLCRALNRTRQNVAGSVPAEALPIGGINPDLEDLVKYTYPDMLPESIRARVEEEKVERKRKFEVRARGVGVLGGGEGRGGVGEGRGCMK